jgi:hypothetical protein
MCLGFSFDLHHHTSSDLDGVMVTYPQYERVIRVCACFIRRKDMYHELNFDSRAYETNRCAHEFSRHAEYVHDAHHVHHGEKTYIMDGGKTRSRCLLMQAQTLARLWFVQMCEKPCGFVSTPEIGLCI